MSDYAKIEETLKTLGALRAVAVAYLETPPPGVPKFEGVQPSSCSFWRLAVERGGFYTSPGDHLNCPIGSYTNAIDPPPERAADLERALSLMAGIGYVRMEEVPSIPRLPRAPSFIYYAPLASSAVDPDVVLVAGRPTVVMRLQEAAVRAGAASSLALLGRPTCMALPAAMTHGAVTSTGCIGNRVYTGLGDDELYLVLSGKHLAGVAGEAATIASANATLAEYHQDRRRTLTM